MVGKIVGGRLQFSALPTPGTGFRIATAGDFDISGKSDLGILNTTQGEFGEFTIWKDMNPVRQVMWRQLKLVWDVQAVGDLDGDGYSDVVWRYVVPGSPDTGVSYVWFAGANGVAQVRKRGGAPLNWQLLGAMDLNDDGAADMLYLGPQGQLRALMATPNRTCANLSVGTLPTELVPLAYADFTARRRGDLLLQNRVTGALEIRALDAIGLALPPYTGAPDDQNASCTASSLVVAQSTITLPSVDPSWRFYAYADFDADGAADIVWRRPDGTLTLWRLGAGGLLSTIVDNIGSAPNGYTSMQTLQPTLSVMTTNASVLPSQVTQLIWDSTRVSSCRASGDWVADIANTGTQNLSFNSAGTKIVTLTCQGAMGPVTQTATITVSAETSFSAPTNVTELQYPLSYLTPTVNPADVSNDPCAIMRSVVTYTPSELGAYPLPTVDGAPFSSSLKRVVLMKDVWEPTNPSYAKGCSGDARTEFTRTLDRIKALGADTIMVTPWTFIGTRSNGDWYIMNPAELRSSTMNDTDLEWAAQQARASNVELVWINQIQGLSDSTVPSANVANINRFFDALEPYMRERAAFLQRIGVPTMEVSCICWTVLESQEWTSVYTARMASLLSQIRPLFRGKFLMRDHSSIKSNSTIASSIDVIRMGMFSSFSTTEIEKLTVGSIRQKYRNNFQGLNGAYHGFDKPVLFVIGMASRADALTTGYLEETFCTSGFNTISGSTDQCIQRQRKTDYALQAMFYEAAFEAIAEQPYFQVYGVATSDYWITNGLVPSSTFPNLAISPRNKPAEGLIKRWFAAP